MADNRQFGSDVPGAEQTLAWLKQLEAATAEYEARENELRTTEIASSNAITENSNALARALEQTRLLTTATGELSTSLRTETDDLLRNVAAWSQRTAVMRAATTVTGGATGANVVGAEAAVVGSQEVRQKARRASAAPVYEQLALETAVAREPARGQLSLLGQVNETRRPSAAPRAAPTSEHVIAPATDVSGIEAADVALRQQAEAEVLAAGAAQRLEQQQQQMIARAAELAQEQQQVNRAYQESVAAYAESSSALSRNGALTTEFIQAFARGDVTLQEFTSQMTSTIGKFGGWAVAGAAVYGAYDAIKKLGEGAKDTQEGVQQLSRFIPDAGTTQRGKTEQTFRDLSLQLNLPISEVTSAMSVMARTFHDVSNAGQAAKAVLLAGRLDQVPQTQSENYFTGIAQSLGFVNSPTGGAQLVGVIDSLNALQNRYGARVNQTLPGLARAAPAAAAAGLATTGGPLGNQNGVPLLEALVASGVRQGITGPQVGTALIRAFNGNQEFTGANVALLRQLGLNPVQGQLGSLFNQIIARQQGPRDQRYSENEVRLIATALGGPLVGPRTLLPILQNARLLPELASTAQNPPQTAQQELSHILGGVGEEFTHIGIVLENLGSELESAGLLSAVQVVLKSVDLLGNGLTTALRPVQDVATVFGELPGPAKDALGAFLAYRAVQLVRGSNFGFASQQFIGRLPGFSGLSPSEQAVAIRTTASRLQTFEIPTLQREREAAATRYRSAARNQQIATAQVASATQVRDSAPEGSEEAATAQAALDEALEKQAATAQQTAVAKEQYLAAAEAERDSQAIVNTLLDKSVDIETKKVVIRQAGLDVEEQILVTNKELLAEKQRQLLADAAGAGVAGASAAVSVAGAGAFNGTGAGALDAAALDVGSVRAAQALRNATPVEAAIAEAGLAATTDPSIANQVLGTGGSLETQVSAAEGGLSFSTAGLLGGAALSGAKGVGNALGENPLGLLIGSQVISSVLPGPVGSALSTAGLLAGGGALAGKYLLPGLASLIDARPGVGLFSASSALEGLGGLGTLGIAGGLAGLGYGVAKGGTGGLLAGIGGGAAVGATIGTATDFITGPLGTIVGGAVGGAVGGIAHELGGVFGLQGNPFQKAQEARAQAQQNARDKALQSAASSYTTGLENGTGASGVSLAAFSSVFKEELNSAFGNINAENTPNAQKAQTAVEQAVQNNVELLKAAGPGTALGKGALGILNSAISGVVTSKTLGTDPYRTGQIIDNATQGILTGVGNRFTYQSSEAVTPGQQASTVDTVAKTLQSSYGAAAGNIITSLKSQVARQEQINKLLSFAGGANQSEDNLLARLKASLSQATALGGQVKILDTETIQSDAQTVFGNISTMASDLEALQSAAAGTNPILQAAAQVLQGKTELAKARSLPLSNPNRKEDIATSQTTIDTGRTARTQALAALLQANESVSAASVPSDDPTEQAQVALANATQYYQRVAANVNALGGPAALKAAIANVNTAQQNLRIAVNAQAQTGYQITEENQAGDPLAAALTSVAAARHALAVALGPTEIANAEDQLAQANQAVHQATTQQITDIGALAASETNNTLQQDADKQAAANRALANAIKNKYGASTIRNLQTAANQQVLQTFNDSISQSLSTLSYQSDTLQISAQQELNKLEQLAKSKNLSVSQRQQISEQEYQIETDQDNTSLFDLSPSGANIKVPTIFDIRSALARAGRRADVGGLGGSVHDKVQIGGATVNTTEGALNTHDVAVEQAIKDLHNMLSNKNMGGSSSHTSIHHSGHSVAKISNAIGHTAHAVSKKLKPAGYMGT